MTSRIWAPYRDSDTQTAQRANSKRAVYENMTVASSSNNNNNRDFILTIVKKAFVACS